MTTLAAENPRPTYGTPAAHIETARHAFVEAAGLLGVPEVLAAMLADQAIVEFQKAVAPHISAPAFELHDIKR
jgi:hypothetical protein